jgi:catechol 2,3-dioxygenase-like lactoylglutathione lyase family enzyme
VKVTASAVSLNVEDVAASSLFLHQQIGFAEVIAAGGFAWLGRHAIGRNVVYLRPGLPALPGGQRDVDATGRIVVFAVDGLESGLARLPAEGARITVPLTCQERGERAFQVRDPNGVIPARRLERAHRHPSAGPDLLERICRPPPKGNTSVR